MFFEEFGAHGIANLIVLSGDPDPMPLIYSFFSLYANIDNFKYLEKTIPVKERPILDQWILSETSHLIALVEGFYNNFEPTLAGREIQAFVVDKLSNWYVRLCRKRFWKGELTDDKKAAYYTLYRCLKDVSILMSPIAPFYSDLIYCHQKKQTIHFWLLCKFFPSSLQCQIPFRLI